LVNVNPRTQRFCVWAGVAFTSLFAIGFWPVAGLMPPPAPGMSPEQLTRLLVEHGTRIRIGLQICIVASALFFPFTALISVYIKRIEGQDSPLAYAQLAAGAGSTLVFIFPLMNMQSAAYRAERGPAIVQAISDMSWIPFVGLLCVPMMQIICLALAIFSDKTPSPVFPRWAGYFNIWVGLSFVPAVLLVFVHSGPVAWNGILSWYLGAVAFFSWIVVMAVLLLRAIRQQEHAESAVPNVG
jgi:hypothetical protein